MNPYASVSMKPNTIWYSDGLRWIGSLFHGAADRLERASLEPPALAPYAHHRHIDEFLADTRHRLYSHF